jgi:hypothetical protein
MPTTRLEPETTIQSRSSKPRTRLRAVSIARHTSCARGFIRPPAGERSRALSNKPQTKKRPPKLPRMAALLHSTRWSALFSSLVADNDELSRSDPHS